METHRRKELQIALINLTIERERLKALEKQERDEIAALPEAAIESDAGQIKIETADCLLNATTDLSDSIESLTSALDEPEGAHA